MSEPLVDERGTGWRSRSGVASAARSLTALVLVLAVTAISWKRMLPVARDTLWAEDASRFLTEQARYGLGGTILRPYAGYLHAVPRLLAALALQVSDLEHLAQTVTLASCVVAGLVGGGLFLLSRPWVRSPVVRAVMGLSAGLLPVLPAETSGNLANLHSYLLVLSPFLFLWTPRRWATSAVGALTALLAAMTEIQVVLFLPLLLLDHRARRRWPVAAAALVGSAAQIVTTLTHPRARESFPVSLGQVVYGYLTMPLAEAWTSHTGIVYRVTTEHRVASVVVGLAVLVAVLALALWRCRGRQRLLALALLYGSVTTWAGALLLNPRPTFVFTRWDERTYAAYPLGRYATISAFLLVLALLVVADALLAGRVTRVLSVALVASLAVGWLTGLSVHSIRDGGPPLPPQVPTVVAGCRSADPSTVARVRGAPAQRSWYLTVDCAEILRLAAR